MKKFWNVMGCIGASLLSVVLVLVTVVFSLRNAAAAFTKPSNITQMVQNINIKELIPDAEDLVQSNPSGDAMTDEELEEVLAPINALLESKTVEEILELYVEDVLAAVTQKNPKKVFSEEAIKSIADKNMDELIAIFRPFIPEDEAVTDEEIRQEIEKIVNEFAGQLAEMLPALTEGSDGMTLGELFGGTKNESDKKSEIFTNDEDYFGGEVRGETAPDSEQPVPYIPGSAKISSKTAMIVALAADIVTDGALPNEPSSEKKDWAEMDPMSAALRFLMDPAVTVAFVIVIVALVILIYGCRFPRFGGLLWLGIDALVVANITGILALTLNSLVPVVMPNDAAIAKPIVGVLSNDLTVTALICLAIGIVFIVGFILLRRFVCNRKPASEASIEE